MINFLLGYFLGLSMGAALVSWADEFHWPDHTQQQVERALQNQRILQGDDPVMPRRRDPC